MEITLNERELAGPLFRYLSITIYNRSICRCSLPKGVDVWTIGATYGDGETFSETLMQPRLKLCPPWCLLLLFQVEEHNCRGIPMISG